MWVVLNIHRELWDPAPQLMRHRRSWKKKSSIQFLPRLSVLGLDINVCSLPGHFWRLIVGSFPHQVRRQLCQSHYMHTHSPPFWRKKKNSIKFTSKGGWSHSWEGNSFHSSLTLLLRHRQSSKRLQQDSHLHTLLPRPHWKSWAFTLRSRYHATNTHLCQVTAQPSHFS